MDVAGTREEQLIDYRIMQEVSTLSQIKSLLYSEDEKITKLGELFSKMIAPVLVSHTGEVHHVLVSHSPVSCCVLAWGTLYRVCRPFCSASQVLESAAVTPAAQPKRVRSGSTMLMVAGNPGGTSNLPLSRLRDSFVITWSLPEEASSYSFQKISNLWTRACERVEGMIAGIQEREGGLTHSDTKFVNRFAVSFLVF